MGRALLTSDDLGAILAGTGVSVRVWRVAIGGRGFFGEQGLNSQTLHGNAIYAYSEVVLGVNVGIYVAYMECLGLAEVGDRAVFFFGLEV